MLQLLPAGTGNRGSEAQLPKTPLLYAYMSVTTRTPVKSPFDKLNADLVIRSSDNIDFRVFRSLLSFASSFFDGMFTLP